MKNFYFRVQEVLNLSIEELKEHILIALRRFSAQDQQKIQEAVKKAEALHAHQKRNSGVLYIQHPLIVSLLLLFLDMDKETVIAGLLHDSLEDTSLSREDLEKQFGPEVLRLVEGVTKIEHMEMASEKQSKAESMRKMLLASIEDIRVLLIKLADRLHNMCTLDFMPLEKQKKIAKETLSIYAPFAQRLGMSFLKNMLEDLCLKYLEPELYKTIRDYVQANRLERQTRLENAQQKVFSEAQKEGIHVEVDFRAKHFYSIYAKMKKKNQALDEIYDIQGLRVLCESVKDCYLVLGILHHAWKPLSGRFKDYIAKPKSNGYQSLHTVVFFEGKFLEVQIRTREMNSLAEFGVAAHWLYKQNNVSHFENIGLVNKLKDWKKYLEEESGENFLEELKNDLLQETIHVFTPQGDMIELPRGSTPVDFAYAIHTEIGDHCYLAKANGKVISLDQRLLDTQMIEIKVSSKAHPQFKWLSFVKTSKARSKIVSSLRKQDKMPVPGSVKNGGFKNAVVLSEQRKKKEEKQEARLKKEQEKLEQEKNQTPLTTEISQASLPKKKILSSFLFQYAACCSPERTQSIVGFISRGRGFIVHSETCPNLKDVTKDLRRLVKLNWSDLEEETIKKILTVCIVFKKEVDVETLKKQMKYLPGKLLSMRFGVEKDFRGYFSFEVFSGYSSGKFLDELKKTFPHFLIQAV